MVLIIIGLAGWFGMGAFVIKAHLNKKITHIATRRPFSMREEESFELASSRLVWGGVGVAITMNINSS